jgi:hypothetical protein
VTEPEPRWIDELPLHAHDWRVPTTPNGNRADRFVEWCRVCGAKSTTIKGYIVPRLRPDAPKSVLDRPRSTDE